jgi:hypothetical protein
MTKKGGHRYFKGNRGKRNEGHKYRVGSSLKHWVDYNKNTEFHIHHLFSTLSYPFELITALRTLREFDIDSLKPVCACSDNQDPKIQERENFVFKCKYEAKFGIYLDEKIAYESNWATAYGYLWIQCTFGMQDKIEALNHFHTKIENNPVELLKAIKEITLGCHSNRLDVAVLLDTVRLFYSTKQKDHESLDDYFLRFKSTSDMMTEQIQYIVANSPGYNANDPENVRIRHEQVFERMMAYNFLDSADKDRYGSLLKLLRSQYSLGQNMFPSTLKEAVRILSEYPPDDADRKMRK